MELFFIKCVAVLIGILGPLLTLFDMSGNLILLATGLGIGILGPSALYNEGLLVMLAACYAAGELWEFAINMLGIKKQKVSWFAVLLIGIGGFVGTLMGTAAMPVIGSFLGGLAGAFVTAFVYELLRSSSGAQAWHLAWETAKCRCLALAGKLAAALAMAVLLFRIAFGA